MLDSDNTTRAEHVAWAKRRALDYVTDPIDEKHQWLASLGSDLNKHAETMGHAGLALGMQMIMGGFLSTPAEIRKFIEGFH